MSDSPETSAPKALPPPEPKSRWKPSGRAMGAGAVAVVLVAGAALGAGGTRLAQRWEPQTVMLLQPAPIDAMRDGNVVAVKGEVSDVFGNKFVLRDSTGRALVDTGPRGEGRVVATGGEAVTVQGRFDRGIIHASVVAHADGRNEAFGPPRGPDGGPGGPKRPKGAKGPKDGPGARADRGPPPPPPPPGDRPGVDDDAPPPPPR